MAMQLVDDLVARAAEADRRMGELADKELASMDREKAYAKIESLFDQMAGDGYLDKNELKSLMQEFRAQGLDTKALEALAADLKSTDGSTRGAEVTADLRLAIGSQLREAKMSSRNPSFALEAQQLMAEHNQCFDLAARCNQKEDEMYMVAIRHLVA